MGDKIYNIENIGTAQFLMQSVDYQDLLKRIEQQRKLVTALQATGDTAAALAEAEYLAQLEQQREQFKEDVLRLAETFSRIDINTERLAQAKAHFEAGEFREADAILNAEQMAQDLDQLIARDQQLDQQKADIAEKRTQLADEYLIKARLQALTYDQPDWFDHACHYFAAALRAARTPAAMFEAALFLQNHNDFNRARPLYEEALTQWRTLAAENPRTYLPDVAMTLNNLGLLQQAQNDYDRAQASYAEALQIRRTLAAENPRTYLPNVAMTLINLSIFYLQARPDREQSIALAREVLEIAQDFQYVPRVMQDAAKAVQVLQANGGEDFRV
jgi:tetratricopeptide (TPR) repeat protein